MAVNTGAKPAGTAQKLHARSPDEVAAALNVHPGTGLTAARAAELLAANGPNALPEEKPKPGWRRFLDQYRSYMQIILIAAALLLCGALLFGLLLHGRDEAFSVKKQTLRPVCSTD